MLTVLPSQANRITLPLVSSDGQPITSGTVTFYLVRLDTLASASVAATHIADGHWYAEFASGAWIEDVQYLCYAKESGDLHIPTSTQILCRVLPTAAENADAVWDEATSGHVSAGTAGEALSQLHGIVEIQGGSISILTQDALYYIMQEMVDLSGNMVAAVAAAESLSAGSGSTIHYFDVTDSNGDPLPDVRVECFSDEALTTRAGYLPSDNFGRCTFYLDPGYYYFVCVKVGYTFNNPTVERVV